MLGFMSDHHNGYFAVPTSLETDVLTVPAAEDPLLGSQICTTCYIYASLVKSQLSLLNQKW